MSGRKSFRGTTLDEALSAACGGLDSRLEELHYDVVSSEGEEVVIEAEVDPVAVLGLFLSESFRAGDLDITAHLADREEALVGVDADHAAFGTGDLGGDPASARDGWFGCCIRRAARQAPRDAAPGPQGGCSQ